MQRLKPSLNPEQEAAEEAKQKQAEVERKALANVKPFLIALFDDDPNGEDLAPVDGFDAMGSAGKKKKKGSDEASYTLVSKAFVPSGDYDESLKRELAKPQRLNFIVSTDRCSLHTKTVPPTFTKYPETGDVTDHMLLLTRPKRLNTNPEQQRRGADGSPTREMKEQKSTGSDHHFLSNHEKRLAKLADQYTPYSGKYHNEERNLKESHLDSLMTSIRDAKSEPSMRSPYIW